MNYDKVQVIKNFSSFFKNKCIQKIPRCIRKNREKKINNNNHKNNK